jgi:hypothetical protein
MLVLSAGARRIVEKAVDRLPDAQQRKDWQAWSTQHPATRRSGEPHNDQTPKIPAHIIAIALLALELAHAETLKKREYASEDNQFEFDNDLTFISSVKKGLVAEAS